MIRDLGAYGTVTNNSTLASLESQVREKMGLKNIHRNNG